MSEGASSTPRGPQPAIRIRSPRDFWGGVVLIALALFAFWAADDLAGMRGISLGPGSAPRMFAGLLALAGAVIAAIGLVKDGPPIEPYAIRGPAYVIFAIVAFAAMIRGIDVDVFGIALKTPGLGLAPSTFFAFMIAIRGAPEMRWLESLAAAVAMTAFCVILFVHLLNLPFQLWPEF
jgi:putative tricarboxylic transport membrane protein